MQRIYEIPEDLNELFQQKEASYRIIDYAINGMEIESLSLFVSLVGIKSESIIERSHTQIVVQHPDYAYNLVINSGWLGDIYSRRYDVTLAEWPQLPE